MARTRSHALAVVGAATATVLAVVLALVVAAVAPVGTALGPAGAWAAFTGTGAASLRASTYAIPAPASVNATFVCTANSRQATATVLGFASVDRATSYIVTLTAPDGTSSSTTPLVTGTAVLTQPSQYAGNRTYTLTVQARIGSWTGAPVARTHTCGQL